jgi:CheY-like chemotaxis protein
MPELLGGGDVTVTTAQGGRDALQLLRRGRYECIVVDALMRDMKLRDFLQQISAVPELHTVPVVVYDDPSVPDEEDRNQDDLADLVAGIVLRRARSLESLVDDCCVFLHRRLSDLPEATRLLLLERPDDEIFHEKSVLIVDDDARNIFALSSLLEGRQMRVASATSGTGALSVVRESTDLSLLLLDIMMPEMDGYETIRRLRNEGFDKPIIALTAKAMSGDREKCLEAGASDYIAKPVDTDQLLALLRVWLER